MGVITAEQSLIEIVSQIILLITSVFVASVCYFVYIREKDRSYFIFSLSFLLFFFGTLLDVAAAQSSSVQLSYAGRALSLLSAAVLYAGFSGEVRSRVFVPALIVFFYTVIVGFLLPEEIYLVNLPAAVASAVYLILSAEKAYRKKIPQIFKIPLSLLLFIWAVHKLDYPLFRYDIKIAWLGYFFTTFIFSGIAFNLLMSMYESKRESTIRSLERLSTIIENLPVVFFELSLKPLRFVYLSPNVHSLIGYPAEKLLVEGSIWKIIEVPERERVVKLLENSMRSGHPVEVTMVVNDASGAKRRFEVIMRPSGHDALFRGVAREITEEFEIKKRLQSFEKAISELDVGIVLLNENDELAYFNPFAGYLMNLKMRNLGEKASELTKNNSLFAEVLGLCTAQQENIIPVQFGRRLRYYRCESFAIKDEAGNYGGTAIFLRDVTEQEQNRRWQERRDVVEKVAESIATVLHDFKNILTAVVGNIEFVKASPGLSEDERDALEDASKASYKAIEPAEELTEISRPVKDVELQKETLSRFIKELLALFSKDERDKIKLQTDEDFEFSTNSKMLLRAVFNIVKNALEASPPDSPVGLKFIRKTDNNKKYLEITIKDYGPGMDQKTLNRVFLPFFSSKRKGTGLGLYIAYSNIRDLGGRIDVESFPGQGTTFHIIIPLD